MNAQTKPTIKSRLLSASVSTGGRATSVEVPAKAYLPVTVMFFVSAFVGSRAVSLALAHGDQVQAITDTMLVTTATLLAMAVTFAINWIMLRRVGVGHDGKMHQGRKTFLGLLNSALLWPGLLFAYAAVMAHTPDTEGPRYWLGLDWFPSESGLGGFAIIVVWLVYGRLVSFYGPFGALAGGEAGVAIGHPRVKLFGQDKAMEAAQSAIGEWIGSNAGMPLSLLFSGPSGVGKTQLAENLSGMYGRKLTQFNMGDISGGTGHFGTPGSGSRSGTDIGKNALIGMPAGYVDAEKGGLLTNALSANPNGIFLFDEMEKAGSGVFDLFLNMLDKGWIADARGRRHNCRNAIFIFTTNVGRDVDPDLPESQVRDKMVRAGFRPELMGRVNKLIQFKPLTLDIAGMIATSALRKELGKLIDRKLPRAKRKKQKETPKIVWQPDMVAKRAALEPLGYDKYGVRVMQRFAKEVGTEIVQLLAEHDGPVSKVVLYPAKHKVPDLAGDEVAIPVGKKVTMDMDAVRDVLHTRVLGQDSAIDVVMEQLSLREMGLIAKPEQPEGTFLFTGPSGTGKTELVKAFADATGRKFLYFHMGNFKDESGVQAFFGAPAGYVGSDKGGQLTQAVLDHPDAVILLDEIEKAAPSIWDGFMGVFDDGRAKDTSSGEMVPFNRTIIFMTSNLITVDVDGETARELVRESGYFRPEMVNRIEHVVPFRPLDDKSKLAIVEKVMQNLLDNYNKANGEDVRIKRGWVERYRDVDLTHGVRDLQRRIQRDLLRILQR